MGFFPVFSLRNRTWKRCRESTFILFLFKLKAIWFVINKHTKVMIWKDMDGSGE